MLWVNNARGMGAGVKRSLYHKDCLLLKRLLLLMLKFRNRVSMTICIFLMTLITPFYPFRTGIWGVMKGVPTRTEGVYAPFQRGIYQSATGFWGVMKGGAYPYRRGLYPVPKGVSTRKQRGLTPSGRGYLPVMKGSIGRTKRGYLPVRDEFFGVPKGVITRKERV